MYFLIRSKTGDAPAVIDYATNKKNSFDMILCFTKLWSLSDKKLSTTFIY